MAEGKGKLSLDSVVSNSQISHWKIRLFLTVFMLILAFIGLIITYSVSIESPISWYAWLIIGPIYAILAIVLAIYFRKNKNDLAFGVWHEIIHWIAFIVALFVLHVYVHTGLVGKFEGGLFILDILAFSVLISGIYLDATFLVVGIVLTIFALLVSILTKYLAIILIVVVILIAATITFFMIRRKAETTEDLALRRQAEKKAKETEETLETKDSKDENNNEK